MLRELINPIIKEVDPTAAVVVNDEVNVWGNNQKSAKSKDLNLTKAKNI